MTIAFRLLSPGGGRSNWLRVTMTEKSKRKVLVEVALAAEVYVVYVGQHIKLVCVCLKLVSKF